jgi:uncharacterized membrane protein YuzA (DUF378 family)
LVTTETGTWFSEHDVIANRLASLAGSAETAEFPYVAPTNTPAGEIIGDFVERCLAEERAVTASLEARGFRVLASAGTVVAVLIGLVAIAPTSISGWTSTFLIVGLACLLVSAALAVVCASPKRTVDIDPGSVEAKLTDQAWQARAELARRSVARSQLKVWASIRAVNTRLIGWLRFAVIAHVIGLTVASTAALVIVLR